MRMCPWCETELYDDPEAEVQETVCPNCENELGDYRTVGLDLEGNPDEALSGATVKSNPSAAGTGSRTYDAKPVNRLRSEWFGDLEAESDPADAEWEEPAVKDNARAAGGNAGWEHYDQVVRKLQDANDDLLTCSTCHENMIAVGEMTVGAAAWQDIRPDGWKNPLLSAPFKLTMWLCPACFRTEQLLSEPERDALIRNWSSEGE